MTDLAVMPRLEVPTVALIAEELSIRQDRHSLSKARSEDRTIRLGRERSSQSGDRMKSERTLGERRDELGWTWGVSYGLCSCI